MRARFLIAAGLTASLIATCGYKSDDGDPGGTAGAGGESFPPAPPRMVHGDGIVGAGFVEPDASAAGGGDGGASGGAGGAGGSIEPPRRDAALPPPRFDASLPRADMGGGSACTPCNPLRQDCARAQACYPRVGGVACCAPAGGSGPGAPCTDSAQCDRGSICTSGPSGDAMLCRELCDAMLATCPGGRCRPLGGGMGGVGYCAP